MGASKRQKSAPRRKKKTGSAKGQASKRQWSKKAPPPAGRSAARSLVALQVHYRVSESYLVDLAEDISPGGIFIRTSRPLPKGTRVEIMFGEPREERQVIAEGRVVWSNEKKVRGADRRGMGVEFTRVDVEGQRFIDNVIHDFLRKVSVV